MEALLSLLCCSIALPVLPVHAQDGISWSKRAQLVTIKKSGQKWQGAATYPVFSANTPVARHANGKLRAEAQQNVESTAAEFAGDTMADAPPAKYDFQSKPTLYFQGPKPISMGVLTYSYLGGAHGNYGIDARNYGISSARPRLLNLGDFFRPNSNYRAATEAKILTKLSRNERAEWVRNGDVKILETAQLNNFVVDAHGLRWIFGLYEVGPFSAGSIEAKLTWNELGPHVRRDFLK